jgi:putative FmdB family regulatory protein
MLSSSHLFYTPSPGKSEVFFNIPRVFFQGRRSPQNSSFENCPFALCSSAFMPTYEYACSKCGHAFEKVQSIKANALTVCPRDACPRKPWGKGKVLRRIGLGGGLLYKGTGFYTTDYRSDNYKAAAKKETAAQTPAKTEAKPAASTGSAAPKSAGSDSAAKSGAPPPAAPAGGKDSR